VAQIVGAAVRSLPPLQREVLVLTHYEGFALDEIARAVGAEAGAVKARLHRARENLKRALAPLKQQRKGYGANGAVNDSELEPGDKGWCMMSALWTLNRNYSFLART
jgi:Sigma-70, region 4